MRDIQELLEQLQEQLEQRVNVTKTTNKADRPLAIFYAGTRSQEAQPDIEQTLRRVWRVRADSVCHFLIEQDHFFVSSSGKSCEAVTRQNVINRMEQMQGKNDHFIKLSEVLLCLVQNTDQYTTMEEFTRDYLAIDSFVEEFDPEAKTLKLILLGESNQNRALAGQIKAYLRNAQNAGSPECRTTVLLSNRLSGGMLLQGNMLRENYFLAGNIILLLNGWNEHFKSVYDTVFPMGPVGLVTPAYSRITRPNRDIAEVMVNELLEWLHQSFDKGGTLQASDIARRLEITGGSMAAINQSYKKNMFAKVPGRETLECLPRSIMSLQVVGDLPFERFDNVTMNSFELFFEMNVVAQCASEAYAEQFQNEFKRFVQRTFTPKEAAYSLTPQMVDAVLDEVNTEDPDKNQPAYAYMCKRVEMQYCKQMIPICRAVLLEVGSEAAGYINQLHSLVDRFNLNYMLDVNSSVQQFYGPMVKQSMDGELGKQFIDLLNKERLTDTSLLNVLYDVLVMIIAQYPIFAMPLPDELAKRMGGNKNTMQLMVRQELTETLGEKIRLRTSIKPDKCLDVIMLDSSREIFGFLQQMYPDMIAMDTGNSSAVELIQFYRIGSAII